MDTPVAYSTLPLVFDTLPAVKTRHFTGEKETARIYTMGRMYLLNGEMRLSLSAFEREPPPQSRVALALAGSGENTLLVCLSPQQAALSLCPAAPTLLDETPGKPLPMPAPEFFAGVDEQGWYWGASLTLPAKALALLGGGFADGQRFKAALYKYRTGDPACGASCPQKEAGTPLQPASWDSFLVTAY